MGRKRKRGEGGRRHEMRLGGKGGGGPRNNLPFPTFFEGRNYQFFTFFYKKVLNAFFWLLTCISFNWKEFVLYGRIPHRNTFLAGVKMKVGGGVEVVVGLFPPSSFLFLAPFTFGIIVIREREEEARGDSELEGGGGGGNGDFSFPVYYNNFFGQTHPTQHEVSWHCHT